MNVSSGSAWGLGEGMRSFESAARDVARATTPTFAPAASPSADVPTTVRSAAPVDPLEGRPDLGAALVDMVAAQRAFSANLAVLRAERETQAELVRIAR